MLRLDDLEMRDDVQSAGSTLWSGISDENVTNNADIDGYWQDFFTMFGFHLKGVDYDGDVSIDVSIPSLHV